MNKITKDPMFRYLALLSIAATVGLQVWRTLFNNFAVEIVHLEGNHIAAVIIPALGGLMWILDYRIPFIAGALMSAISLSLVQFIKFENRTTSVPN